jgi:hypothetical protein
MYVPSLIAMQTMFSTGNFSHPIMDIEKCRAGNPHKWYFENASFDSLQS